MNDSERIKELHDDMKMLLRDRLPSIETRITKLETKHAVWGAVCGFIAGILGAVIAFGINTNIRK